MKNTQTRPAPAGMEKLPRRTPRAAAPCHDDPAPLLITNTTEMLNERAVLSAHFTLAELTASAAAALHGIDNLPCGQALEHLRTLCCELLEPLRMAYTLPVIVTSGYRCPRLNALLAGAPHSQHLTGQAADIVAGWQRTAPAHGTRQPAPHPLQANRALFTLLAAGCRDAQGHVTPFSFDQLIWERGGRWIHVSYVHRNTNRNAILASPAPGIYTGISGNWQQVINAPAR